MIKFKIKNYKFLKTKNYFKSLNTFLIYNGTTIKNFVIIDQKLKKLNLKHYKISNSITKTILCKSIYKNFKSVINGLIIILTSNDNRNEFVLKQLLKISNSFKFIGLKIHDKIYIKSILNPMLLKKLNYNNTNLIFLKLLKTYLKTTLKINI